MFIRILIQSYLTFAFVFTTGLVTVINKEEESLGKSIKDLSLLIFMASFLLLPILALLFLIKNKKNLKNS